jgi:ABC-type glutathione transport system ATPase component
MHRWYLEQIRFGGQHPLFIFRSVRSDPTHNKESAVQMSPSPRASRNSEQRVSLNDVDVEDGRHPSSDGSSPRVAVELNNISKTFAGSPPVVALSRVSLKLFEGQVTALLGPNGAGKSCGARTNRTTAAAAAAHARRVYVSLAHAVMPWLLTPARRRRVMATWRDRTAIGLLTGLYPPTSGRASVFGFDLASAMNAIRRVTGVCPQHDLVYDTLTCEQHLELLGAIKGSSGHAEAIEWLDKVGLRDKLHAPAGTLSGGQKRKLSVAMAFIGCTYSHSRSNPDGSQAVRCWECHAIASKPVLSWSDDRAVVWSQRPSLCCWTSRLRAWTPSHAAPSGTLSRLRGLIAPSCSQ